MNIGKLRARKRNISFLSKKDGYLFSWVHLDYNRLSEVKTRSYYFITTACIIIKIQFAAILIVIVILITMLFYYPETHFKNRCNFTNFCHYKNNFDIEIKWPFYSTAYKNIQYDEVGGSSKRLAVRANFQSSS